MLRLLFEKTGDSVWISHLDLMRVFQRAFRRAGLHLKHSQGFNPRAIVSIALPLSVGVDSCCELLDFELDGDQVPVEDIAARLNEKLPAGIRVLEAYEAVRKIKELTDLQATVTLEYDNGVPETAVEEIKALFRRDTLILKKHSRKGEVETDILPLLKYLEVTKIDDNSLSLRLMAAAQNPSLNPQLLVTAIELYLPEMAPVFSRCSRLEIFDAAGLVFR